MPFFVYRIDIIESERGWGQKLDSQLDFLTEKEAQDAADKINAELGKNVCTPDIYVMADRPYKVDLEKVGPPK